MLVFAPREVSEPFADTRRLLLAAPAAQLPPQYRKYRQPRLIPWELPYRAWESEYRHHFEGLYGDPSLSLRPSAIVMHYTVIDDAQAVWNSFVRGTTMALGDQTHFGHPSVQLMVDKDGKVYRLMPLNRKCTGAYGADHVALSIEMVARDEQDLLSRPSQVFASFCLVRWLTEFYNIPASRVHSHTEVAMGLLVFPEFTDKADPVWWFAYPPKSFRFDPGPRYMALLRRYLLEGREGRL